MPHNLSASTFDLTRLRRLPINVPFWNQPLHTSRTVAKLIIVLRSWYLSAPHATPQSNRDNTLPLRLHFIIWQTLNKELIETRKYSFVSSNPFLPGCSEIAAMSAYQATADSLDPSVRLQSTGFPSNHTSPRHGRGLTSNVTTATEHETLWDL